MVTCIVLLFIITARFAADVGIKYTKLYDVISVERALYIGRILHDIVLRLDCGTIYRHIDIRRGKSHGTLRLGIYLATPIHYHSTRRTALSNAIIILLWLCRN